MWTKPIINILLILAIIALIVFSVITIKGFVRAQKITNEDDIQNVDVSILDLDKNYIRNFVKLDDEKYAIFLNIEPTEEKLESSVAIYIYDNLKNEISSKYLAFDTEFLEFFSSDENGKMYVVEYTSNNADEKIMQIDYENMLILSEKKSKDISELLAHPNGEKIVYRSDNGLCISNTDFSNEKVLLKFEKGDSVQEDISYVPIQFISNNELVYKKVGYEWSCGVGIYNIETRQNKFIEKYDSEYLTGNDDEMYIFDSYVVYPIIKTSLNDKNEEGTIVIQENNAQGGIIRASDDGKKCFIEFYTNANESENDIEHIYVYDLSNGKAINKHSYNVNPKTYDSIINAYFDNNDETIVYMTTTGLYKWNIGK